MDKRGLSNIVVSVLVVLLSLIGVGIVYAFVSPFFGDSGVEIQEQTDCSLVEVVPKKCLHNTGSGVVEVRASVEKGAAKGIAVSVEFNDMSFDTQQVVETGDGVIDTYDSRVINSFAIPVDALAVRAEAYPIIIGANGEEVICNKNSVKIMCGDVLCTSDSECGTGEDCVDGVCTVFQEGQRGGCSGDDDCANGMVCGIGGFCVSRGSSSSVGGTCNTDSDNDNFISTSCGGGNDCNDGDGSVYPGATEDCGNSIDDDCDGEVNEGCGTQTCTDGDGDGWNATAGGACGSVADCDDGDEYQYPGQRWYYDSDGDNYSSTNPPIPPTQDYPLEQCDYPGVSVWIPSEFMLGDDCNDAFASVNPGATEDCGNSIDDDCDGDIDGADSDCSAQSCTDAGGVCVPDSGCYGGTSVSGETCPGSDTCCVSNNCEDYPEGSCTTDGSDTCSAGYVVMHQGNAYCHDSYGAPGIDSVCCVPGAIP